MAEKAEEHQIKFGSKLLSANFNNYMLAQTAILKRIAVTEKFTGRCAEMRVVLLSSTGVAVGINRLGREDMLNEATMLMRSLIERLINFCYILVCEEAEFEKYKSHSLQKAYRKLNREERAGSHKVSLKYTGEINLDDTPNLRSSIEQFTGTKGKEKTRWTNVDLNSRVSLIGEKIKVFEVRTWLLAILAHYEDASEALHGTYYGSIFHTGLHEPGFDKNNKEETQLNYQKKLSLLFYAAGNLVGQVIALLNELGQLNCPEDVSGSAKNVDDAGKILRRALDNSKKNAGSSSDLGKSSK